MWSSVVEMLSHKLEAVIEHLMRSQGQSRGVQMYATHLSEQKGIYPFPDLI